MWYCVTVPELDKDSRYAKADDEQAAVNALFGPANRRRGDGFLVWITGELFRAEVAPVTDAVLIARLDGAPMLPLALEESDGKTAAPYAPDAYQRQALATWRVTRPPTSSGGLADALREHQMHALLGLVGEAGELADLLKKHFFKPDRVATREQVLEELADVAYYVAVLAHLWGFTFDDMFAHLAGKLAGGHGWVTPSNSTGLEGGDHA